MSFAFTLATTNDALDVAVRAVPQLPSSALVLASATTHTLVDARLSLAFEGPFVLDAPGSGVAQVVADTTARDPAGRERASAVTRYQGPPRHVTGEA